MPANRRARSRATTDLSYLSLRQVSSPEDEAAGRKRYCGVASAEQLFDLETSENVRGFLGQDHEGKKRKSTLVNMAIRKTLEDNRDLFPSLNAGLVVVARGAKVDDKAKVIALSRPSIINGAQTQGVLLEYFEQHSDDTEYPSVNFEIVVTNDEELIAEISIARNFQNRVSDLSIYGRHGLFDEIEGRMAKHEPGLKLRKSETDFDPSQIDTEKLIQVITAISPRGVKLPSAERRATKTPETEYRVYAYRHRSRCLKDFADVINDPGGWKDAHQFFLDMAWPAWALYKQLKNEQAFSALQKVEGRTEKGRKVVAPDGVPDGLVFPMLSALSRFAEKVRGKWKLKVPTTFPWQTLYRQAMTQHKTTAGHNPQTMGKSSDCYVALHGAIDMYFDVIGQES